MTDSPKPTQESLERAKEIVEVWTYSMTVTGQEKLAAVIANALDQARNDALEEAALECERRQNHHVRGSLASRVAQGCATTIRAIKSKESEWERRQALYKSKATT